MQVVVGAAVAGAVYAGISYFNKDKNVQESFNRFGRDVSQDATGENHQDAFALSQACDAEAAHYLLLA